MNDSLQTAVFGGGCFWCTEAIYRRLRGVISVKSGYAGGSVANPNYDQVSMGRTGHAESIEIQFDPKQISYQDLLNVFFATHDPTTPNQQGHDVGPQYRSAIFFANNDQRDAALAYIKQLDDEEVYDAPIVTEVSPLDKFWPAESYHQRYYETNQNKPYCQLVINPKIAKLRAKFGPLLKPDTEAL